MPKITLAQPEGLGSLQVTGCKGFDQNISAQLLGSAQALGWLDGQAETQGDSNFTAVPAGSNWLS